MQEPAAIDPGFVKHTHACNAMRNCCGAAPPSAMVLCLPAAQHVMAPLLSPVLNAASLQEDGCYNRRQNSLRIRAERQKNAESCSACQWASKLRASSDYTRAQAWWRQKNAGRKISKPGKNGWRAAQAAASLLHVQHGANVYVQAENGMGGFARRDSKCATLENLIVCKNP